MSEADKLFEELGYKMEVHEGEIDYVRDIKDGWKKIISFWLNAKMFCVMSRKSIPEIMPVFNGMQELKAINMKCKELGWSDE